MSIQIIYLHNYRNFLIFYQNNHHAIHIIFYFIIKNYLFIMAFTKIFFKTVINY